MSRLKLKLKTINPTTLLGWLAGLAVLGFVVHKGWSPEQVAATAAAIATLLAQAEKLFRVPPGTPPNALLPFLAFLGMSLACGCSAPLPPKAQTAAEKAAEAAYSAQLLRCVDAAKTLQESRACRAEVNRAWGISEKETGR